MFAVRSLTSAIAPFIFGVVYRATTTKSVDFPSLIYVVTAVIILCTLPMILGPLVKSIEQTKGKKGANVE